jgi:hypothetical protein
MISTNNNFNNNVGNAQQPEKSNWKIARIFGKNPNDTSKVAILEIGLYKSQYSMFATLSIKNEMGRDSKNRIQFETILNKDNPSVLLAPENVTTVLFLCNLVENDPSVVKNLNFKLETTRSKLEIKGSDTATLLTVTNEIGSKSIQFDAVPAGFTNIHGCYDSIKNALKVIQKKQFTIKLDPDEFGSSSNDEDAPF